MTLACCGSPQQRRIFIFFLRSHQETIHLFTYARLRQMLNNSSREADDMQLYLGYGGAWVLSLPEFVQPEKKKKKGIQALLYRQNRANAKKKKEKSRTLCITDPTERHNKKWKMKLQKCSVPNYNAGRVELGTLEDGSVFFSLSFFLKASFWCSCEEAQLSSSIQFKDCCQDQPSIPPPPFFYSIQIKLV